MNYQFDAHVWAWRMHQCGMDDLFEAYARRTDPETSHAAAASLNEEDVTRLENEVWLAIDACLLGANWDELGSITGIDKASISPRFKPLREKGRICWHYDEDGEIIKRRGKSGRNQIVWFSNVGGKHGNTDMVSEGKGGGGGHGWRNAAAADRGKATGDT